MSLPQPVFILASPFSFTSIVCAMLGQHPEAYGLPEINLLITDTLEQLLEQMSGQRQAWLLHGLLRAVAQLYSGEQTRESIEMAQRWLRKRMSQSTQEVYFELCRKVAPLRLVDKSPIYCNPQKPDIIERLKKTFPDAHYLYLLRHPRSQGKSWQKIPTAMLGLLSIDSLDYSTNPPTIDPQYDWYRKQRQILDFLNTLPQHQQLCLRGEEFLNDPRPHLEQICQWLKLSWDESIYQRMLRTEDSSYACVGPYGTQWGNNPGFQKSPAFRFGQIAPSKLEGPLPWRQDGKGFIPEVIQLARELGYT